jgi:transcription-repair coupling factor (superfamily II helicase)
MGGRGAAATAKLSPLSLPASAEVRLRRLAPGAVYQGDQARLVVPLTPPGSGGEFAPLLVDLLSGLVPRVDVGSAPPVAVP